MGIIDVTIGHASDSKEPNVEGHPIVQLCEEILVEAARRHVELVVLTAPEVWWFRDGWKLARTLERATYDQLMRRLCVVVNGNAPKEHNSLWNAITLAPGNKDAVYCFTAEIFAFPQGVLRAIVEIVPSLTALRERVEANQLQPRVPPDLPLPGWGSRSPYR